MAKNTILIFVWFWAVNPVLAQKHETDEYIKIQRGVLKEMLAERYISEFEYDRKMAALTSREYLSRIETSRETLQKRGTNGTGSISGTVQVAGLNQPGVLVSLFRAGSSNSYAGGAVTDAAGNFIISDLVAGDYSLFTNDNNDSFINAMWSLGGTEQCFRCLPFAQNTISLADAENRTGIDMDLEVGASISGQVLFSGNPVPNMFVSINPGDTQHGYHANVETDAVGNYSVNGLPTGDYYLTAINPQDNYIDAIWTSTGTQIFTGFQFDPAHAISLIAPDALVGFDFSLTQGATLTGQITDALTNDAIETLNIGLFDTLNPNNYGNFYTEFDGLGGYTVRGIPQGSYKVFLEEHPTLVNEYVPEIYNNIPCNLCSNMVFNGAGDVVVLNNGVTTTGIDFALETGASISGKILNAAHMPETVEEFGYVLVFNVTNRLIATLFLNGTNYEPLFDGSFKIGGLLPGTYFVQGGDLGREFFQRELYDDVRCPWSGCDRGAGGDPVILGPSEQRLGVDFNLEYGGKISGVVTDLITGNPLVAQYVQFYDAAGLVAGGAVVRANGNYISQRALPPGTYSVRTGSMFDGVFNAPYVMEKYDQAGNIDCPGVTCDLTVGNVVVPAYVRQTPRDPVAEAAAATVTGIDFALSTAFSFSGTITELGSANPIPDVHVLVYDDNGVFATWATTDAMGDFTVSGLPAGTYYALTNNGSNLPFIGFFPTEVGTWIDILFGGTPCPGSTCDVTTGDPIVLGGGGPIVSLSGGGSVLDFSLNAGGSITGQVNTFGSALPAQYVDVNVYNSDGVFYGSYPSDDSGHYLTVGLPDGTYYLTTSNNGGLIDAKFGGDYCADESCDPLDATPVVISAGQSLTDVDFDLRTDYLFKNGVD